MRRPPTHARAVSGPPRGPTWSETTPADYNAAVPAPAADLDTPRPLIGSSTLKGEVQ